MRNCLKSKRIRLVREAVNQKMIRIIEIPEAERHRNENPKHDQDSNLLLDQAACDGVIPDLSVRHEIHLMLLK